MTLDPFSVLAVTGLVVILAGALFIVETLLRRDEGAGRLWALSYLAAMLMTLSYVLWTQSEGAWWAIAVGNAALVASSGFMWLGCREFNGQRMLVPAVLVAAATTVAAVAAVVDAAADPLWAGAEWMFIALVLLAGAAAVECARGALLQTRTAWVLAFALGVYALYYISRTTALLTSGAGSALFTTAFGSVSTSLITAGYLTVAVVTTSVLRASRAPMRGYVTPSNSVDGVIGHGEFTRELTALCERASWRSETVGVISVRIDDLDQLSTAFGSEMARAVSTTWRRGVRRHAPSNSFVGEDGPSGLAVGVLVASPTEARRQAAAIYRGLFDDLGDSGTGVIPVVGVGVALSDDVGCEPTALTRVARDAASRAALSVETSVLVGDAD